MKEETTERVEGKTGGATVSKPSPMSEGDKKLWHYAKQISEATGMSPEEIVKGVKRLVEESARQIKEREEQAKKNREATPKEIEKARQIIAWLQDDYDIIGCDVRRQYRRGFKTVMSIYRKEGGKVYVVNIRDYIKNRCEDREHFETDFEGAARILAKFGKLETAEKIESVKKSVDRFLNAIGYGGE